MVEICFSYVIFMFIRRKTMNKKYILNNIILLMLGVACILINTTISKMLGLGAIIASTILMIKRIDPFNYK